MKSFLASAKRYGIPAFFSLVLTFGVWFFTDSAESGIIVGLLSNLTFQFIEHLELVRRVGRYLDTHREIVDSADGMVALARESRMIDQEGSILKKHIAESAIVRLKEDLESLCAGKWTVHSFEAYADVTEQLFDRSNLKHEYCGTSVVRDYEDYWRGAPAQRLNDATMDAIARKVKVKRVFICPSEQDYQRIVPVMQKQHAMGIEVRYLMEEDKPLGIAVVDCGIWDGKVAVELTEARHGGVDFCATFRFSGGEAARFGKIFQSLFAHASPFSPHLAEQAPATPASATPFPDAVAQVPKQ